MKPRERCLPILLFLCLLGSTPASAATPVAEQLAAARTQWDAGRFAAAGQALERAYRDGAQNAAVCLAAAQAWRQARDNGRMMLWLLRAVWLDPSNPEASQALAAAGVVPPGPRLLLDRRLSPRALVRLALAAGIVWWLGLSLARPGRRSPSRNLLLAGGLVVGWLWLEALCPLADQTFRPHGVVLADSAGLCAPESEAIPLFTLPAGQVVALGPTRGHYRQVTATGDRVAWLPVASLAELTAP